MTSSSQLTTFTLSPVDNQRLAGLCGQLNSNIRQIEGHFGVKIHNRGARFTITGETKKIQGAESVLKRLYAETADNNIILPDMVHLSLSQPQQKNPAVDSFVIKTKRQFVKPQNERQQRYIRNIRDQDISFGIGPAGTGKTYLAVASAVQALEADVVDRIVLVRPAVEAGERLGFLPGDIGQKVDPYLRPLYDALYEMMGFERVGRLLDKQVIELAPLAYMRGRTLNESFVILDEAQNTTGEQMKMFLTRIGFGSKAVITGDITQTDLPRGSVSGLKQAMRILSSIEGISFLHFQPEDVVRHPLVQRIVEAYEDNADVPDVPA